ncbi:protein phosphatase [Strigomonas culicis]|uniref:Protein phosphatase n=1 Tax=Strigomonas culicis TaxID=28005 RepID=S9TZA0_9TRYP|nr:protein phosphatase [Strigomonas culicis]|eukprot:EPY21934.1 protein phosphatase [Strigomonas culicis]
MVESASHKGLAPAPQKSLRSPAEDLLLEQDRLQEIRGRYPYCLDVMVSGVGSSRAFGIVRNPFSEGGKKSLLDTERERMVPLSVDHIPFRTMEYRRITSAGGVLDSGKGNMIDGNPFYNVSRSFGHWSMKNDLRLSPVEQKLIPLPSSMSWEMLPGDILVMSNQALYETRGEELSSMDELAKLAGREIDRGRSPEQVAASLCDFAIRFGADHALQVMVAVATEAPEEALAQQDGLQQLHFEEWVEPGPLYSEVFRRVPAYRASVQHDCDRLGVSLAKLLQLRWERVREILPLRHQLSLMPYYGKECGELQQAMDEEAHLFDHEVLKNRDAAPEHVDALFHRIAQQLGRDTK